MLYTYISHSRTPKTYHGVTFNYGDKKEVSGVINDNRFVFCSSRQNPPAHSAVPADVVEPPKQVGEKAESEVVENAEKPKAIRKRRTKVVEPAIDAITESVVEESVSTEAK